MAAHAVSKTPDEFSKSFYDRLTGISPDFIPVVSCGISSTTMKKILFSSNSVSAGTRISGDICKTPPAAKF